MRARGCKSVGKESGTEGYRMRMRMHFLRVIRMLIRMSMRAKKPLPKERIGQGRAQMSVRAEGREEMRKRGLRQGTDACVCQRCQRMQRMRQETFPESTFPGVAQLCVMVALFSGPCLVHLREP